MHYKVKNELMKADYEGLTDFLDENKGISIEVLPSLNLEFMLISPLSLSAHNSFYIINGEVKFESPIGLEVYDNLKLGKEMDQNLLVNFRSIKMSFAVKDKKRLESELNQCVKILERIVNCACNFLDELVEKALIINSQWLDRQFDNAIKKEDLGKRGEIARPFGTIHARSLKDAKELSGDLVPVFLERDKAYLFEDKNVYLLLPREFVMKLLKIDKTTILPSDYFDAQERQALDKLSMRKYLKTRKIGGKIYYCDLNEKTGKLIISFIKRR